GPPARRLHVLPPRPRARRAVRGRPAGGRRLRAAGVDGRAQPGARGRRDSTAARRSPRQDPQALLRDADGHPSPDLPPVRERPQRPPLLVRALPGECAARDLRVRGVSGAAPPPAPTPVARARRAVKRPGAPRTGSLVAISL